MRNSYFSPPIFGSKFLQENPAPSVGRILSNNPIQKPSPALHQPDSNPASDDRASPSHRSDSPAPISSKIIPTAKQANQVSSVPVPREIWNCDISGVKDAMSALGRAKSHECKELIHNVTCLQRKGELYNTNIKNICPLKRKSGRGFQSISYELGKGPLARVVFLLSVHGRAVRQVKRLFKAIYHTDHYYYIHVDSVSWCINVCVHACVRACVRACMRACMRVCVCVCVCMCACVYILVSVSVCVGVWLMGEIGTGLNISLIAN